MEPKHYRLIKRSASKFAARHQAALSYSDLDEIASRATVYFVQSWNSSQLDDIDHRMNVCASRSARRAVCEYWSESRIGTASDHRRVRSVPNEDLPELWGATLECKPDNTEAMLSRLNRRQRIVAMGIIAGDSWSKIRDDALYASDSGLQSAIKSIRKRIADYAPECHLMRATREACELFIRSKHVTPEPIERDTDNRDDIPRPRRTKSTAPVDVAIPATPGEYRPMQFDAPAQHLPRLPIMPHCCRLSNGFVICG